MKFTLSIARLIDINKALSALHGRAKEVKSNGQSTVIVVPFALSGTSRITLNDNIAALLPILKSYDDAIEVIRKQLNDEVEAQKPRLKDEFPDEDLRAEIEAALEHEANNKLNKEATDMRAQTREVTLEPLYSDHLNEASNAFDPTAIALLKVEGLIVKKPKAKGQPSADGDPADADE